MGGSSKKVTVGYKYYLGMHMVLCHGPVDKIVRIRVDERDAWVGNRRTGRITIRKPDLFGGESREGGIQGDIDFMPGEPTQGVNDYLSSKLGALVPAFRGVTSVVLRRVYIGLNPYLKKWDFRVSRVLTRQDGIPQWYPQAASIPTAEAFKVRQRILFAIDDSGSMNQIVSGSRTRLDVMKDNMANVLDEIKILKMDSQVPVDLAVVKLNGGSISYADASPTQIDAVKTYILNMTASGNTPFQGAFSYAKSWFSAHSEERRNVMVLISDGEPWPLEDFPAAVAEAAPILNRTGTWSGNNEVDVYAVNIDLGNTFYSQQLDNTPGDGGPVVDGSSSDELYNAVFFAFMGDSPAMNIVHAIRECLTDPTWGMGYAEADLDDTSFRAAADRLRSERLGICLIWDRQKTIQDMIQELLKHADAALYVDRKTGLFKIKLIRDDYDVDTLLHLTEANITKVENFSRPTFGELTTSVTVNYWNVSTGRNASITVQDIALASMQQAHVATTLQYPGLPDLVMASRVAQRALKLLSSQLGKAVIYADRSAKDVSIGDAIKVTWPEYALYETVFRVAEVAYGDGRSNRIKLTVIEDAFGMPEVELVTPGDPVWENPSAPPSAVTRQVAFEAPYYELVQRQGSAVVDTILAGNPDAGYVGAAGVSPGGAAINARTYTNNGSGYEDIGVMDFSPGASLAVAVDQMEETFMLAQGSALDLVNAGTWGQIDEELFAVVGISGNVMTVKRGVLDTAVRPHAEGAPIIFWDESSTVDDTEYVTSEQVAVKLATVSGSGELPLEQATEMSVTMRGRANRPYPPGDMKLNGEYFPEELVGNADILVTFATRNRLQQTGGALLGFTDGDVTPEVGVDYLVEAYQAGTNVLIYDASGSASPITIPANSLNTVPEVDLRLYSRRGALLSYQYQLARFLLETQDWVYEPTPFQIAVPRTIVAFDWAQASGDTDAVIPPHASWASTDYVVICFSSIATTVTPPAGLTLLGQYQNTSDTNLWTRIYGGQRGSASSWTFTLPPGGAFAALAVAAAGIDLTTPLKAITWNTVASAGTTRNVWAPSEDVVTTDGLYAATFFSGNANPAGNTYRPSNTVATPEAGAWTSWPPNTRRVYGSMFPVAEGLTKVVPPRFDLAATVAASTGCMVVLNRAAGVRSTPVPNFTVLDDYLASFSVGYAWIALHNGVVVDSKAAGFARDASAPAPSSVPFTLNTVAPIASITKILTELAIRRLVAEGSLSLSDTISSRLSGYSFGTGVGAVTIRDLLRMTSGISAVFSLTGPHPSTLASWLTNSASNPGQWYQYQNGNFAALHEIIAQVTGQAYTTWMQANVLDPLGITTAVTAPPANGVLAYRSSGGIAAVTPLAVPATGAGGYCMSCEDLAKIARGLRQPLVLPANLLKEMLNDRFRASPTYGARGEMHQHDGLLLDGNNRGVRAQLVRVSDGYDVVAMTNTYNVDASGILPSVRGCFTNV